MKTLSGPTTYCNCGLQEQICNTTLATGRSRITSISIIAQRVNNLVMHMPAIDQSDWPVIAQIPCPG